MPLRHEAGFRLLGKAPVQPPPARTSPAAVLGASQRQAVADGSITTDWPAGSSRTMPGEARGGQGNQTGP